MRAALIALVLLACDTPGHPQTGGPPVDFTIAGIAFHISSGAVVTSGGALTFYLSDQPDTCAAIINQPVGTTTTLTLHVSPPADGSTTVTIVDKAVAAAGEAVGSLVRATGGNPGATVTAASGTVSWTANADRSYALTNIDLGFAGTTDRVTTYGLLLAPCP